MISMKNETSGLSHNSTDFQMITRSNSTKIKQMLLVKELRLIKLRKLETASLK